MADRSPQLLVAGQGHLKQQNGPHRCFSRDSIKTNKAPSNKQSDYYQVMKPFLWSMRLIGGLPYTVRNGNLQFELFSFWTIYSVVFTSVMVSLLMYAAFKSLLSQESTNVNKVFLAFVGLIVAAQALGPISVWIFWPEIIRYIGKWRSYQDKLHAHNITMKVNLRIWAKVALLLASPLILGLAFFQAKHNGGPVNTPPAFFVAYHTTLSMLLFTATCLYIRSVSVLLLRHARKCRDGRDIARCRELWLDLTELTTELGRLLGPAILLFLLMIGSMFVSSSYSLMFLFREQSLNAGLELNEAFQSRLSFLLIASISAVSFCEFGHICSSAVGYKFQRKIHQFSFIPQDQDFHNELDLFIHTISLNYPNLELCGFVTLNRKLLFSLMSGGITYLIVLVQFRSSE